MNDIHIYVYVVRKYFSNCIDILGELNFSHWNFISSKLWVVVQTFYAMSIPLHIWWELIKFIPPPLTQTIFVHIKPPRHAVLRKISLYFFSSTFSVSPPLQLKILRYINALTYMSQSILSILLIWTPCLSRGYISKEIWKWMSVLT